MQNESAARTLSLMSSARLFVLAAVILGLLSFVSCDEPEPNRCLEFITCYAECRAELQIGEECLPNYHCDPVECSESVLENSPAAGDDRRCRDRCENGNTIIPPNYSHFYPLENSSGLWWRTTADCLNGAPGEYNYSSRTNGS